MHTIPWLLAGLVAGFLISLVWKQSTPRLTVNPSGRMQLWKASVLTLYLILSTAITAYAVYSLWDVQPPASDRRNKEAMCPAPAAFQLLDLDPDSIPAGFAPRDVTLLGCNFTQQTQVRLNGVVRQSQYLSANKISVTLNSTDVNAPSAIVVAVSDTGQAAGAGPSTATEKTLRVKPAKVVWYFCIWHWDISIEVQLILLVLFTGAFGSSVYALKSIADFIGMKELCESWFTFYLVQPWEGAGIAFLFYMVMRGGLVAGTGGDVRSINPFGITAIAALVGAFSDRAFNKLRDVTETLFASKDARGDKGTELKITTGSPLPAADHTDPKGYQITFRAINGTRPYTWSSAATLPPWLTLSPGGDLSGKPPAPQTVTLSIKVADSAGATATKNFDLQVV